MESVTAVLFIGTAIAGITEFIKLCIAKDKGAMTIAIAVVIGVLVAVFGDSIGIERITVATGIMLGFSAAGVMTAAKKIG
jgi:hypothetical protein